VETGLTVWLAGAVVSEKSAASVFKIRAGPLLTLQTEAPYTSDTVAPVRRRKPEHSNGDEIADNNSGRCEKSWNFLPSEINALLGKNTRCVYTGCPRRNVPDFGRVFLMLKYTDITQNTYVQS
jgi:hypothetical protein